MISHGLRIRLAAARRRLAANADEAASVADVARGAGLSAGYFIRRFTTVFGDTPHQFRIRARLEWARRQLALTDLPVTDICMASGFSSLGSFSALFRRRVGLPPSEYRARARGRSPEEAAATVGPACLDLMNRAWAKSGSSTDGNFGEARNESPR